MMMDFRKILRYSAYAVELLFAFVLQTTPYFLPSMFGEKAVLLIPLAISASVFERDIPAVIFGALCGVFADLSYSGTMGFFGIFLVIISYITSRLMTDYIKTNMISVMTVGTVGVILVLTAHFLFYCVFAGYTGLWTIFSCRYLIRILYTVAFIPLFYLLNKKISLKSQRRRRL